MPNEIDGLPVHVLLVHGVVVLVPLTALLLVLSAVLPAVRARLGIVLPALAASCVALVPLTTRAGEWLQERIGGGGPLVQRHAELGEGLLPWTVGLLVLSAVVWWRGRRGVPVPVRRERQLSGSRGEARSAALLQVAVAVLSAAVALGAVVQVVRTGDSGARAVWSGVLEQS